MKSRFLNKGRSIYFKAINGSSYDCFGEYIGYNEETNQIYLKYNGKYFFGELVHRGKLKCKKLLVILITKLFKKI